MGFPPLFSSLFLMRWYATLMRFREKRKKNTCFDSTPCGYFSYLPSSIWFQNSLLIFPAVASGYANMEDAMTERMIHSGIPLEEPYLQSRLIFMANLERKGLKEGKLPIDDCYSLMVQQILLESWNPQKFVWYCKWAIFSFISVSFKCFFLYIAIVLHLWKLLRNFKCLFLSGWFFSSNART